MEANYRKMTETNYRKTAVVLMVEDALIAKGYEILGHDAKAKDGYNFSFVARDNGKDIVLIGVDTVENDFNEAACATYRQFEDALIDLLSSGKLDDVPDHTFSRYDQISVLIHGSKAIIRHCVNALGEKEVA